MENRDDDNDNNDDDVSACLNLNEIKTESIEGNEVMKKQRD